MHAFWTVLLIPLSIIAARQTVAYMRKNPEISPDSAVKIWKLIFAMVTAIVVMMVASDVVMFCLTETKHFAAQPIIMRALFRLITAVDFPLTQLWIGSLIGFLICRRGASRPVSATAQTQSLPEETLETLASSAAADH